MSITRLKSAPASIFLLLITLTLCLYMLTFRGAIQTGDTLRALDAVTSQARYGDWLMDESNYTQPALIIRDDMKLPLSEYDVEERLNIVLAQPLLKLADWLPRLGALHSVWLLNIFATALIVGLLYCMARAMQAGEAGAALLAFSAAAGTNLWSYAQTFFREPLSALFVLAAFYMIQLGIGRSARGRCLCLALAAGMMCLALLTKLSTLMALPALLAFALALFIRREGPLARRLAAIALALLCLVTLVLAFIEPLPVAALALFEQLGLDAEFAGAALRSYLFSPGASIWGTSPLVLLGAAGCLMHWRRGRYMLALAICLITLGYALGHALTTGPHWFGGLSWPPRFLLPALPLLMLATAPVAERVLGEGQARLRLLWLGLLLYGAWIQFNGVALSLSHYGEALPAEAQGLGEWLPGMMQPQFFRWFVLPRLWGDLGWDFLWIRGGLPLWGLSFALLGAATAFALIQTLRNGGSRWRLMSLPLAIAGLSLVLLNLSAAYFRDPRTQSSQAALHEARDYLARMAAPGDALLLTSDNYANFALNHFDGGEPRPIVLSLPLAQAVSDKQPSLVDSNNPYDWFDAASLRIIRHLAARHERLWLLDSTSPFMAWSFRPLERYLALHAYPLGAVELRTPDDSARLLAYSARNAAPDPMWLYFGDVAVDLRFGPHIALMSATLPQAGKYQPGGVVELSLLWRADERLERSYTVALFIADAESGQPIAQGNDSAPQAGFAPTNEWQPGLPVWDNRAIGLPLDAKPGSYQIWVIVYDRDGATGEIQRLPARGATVAGEGTIGVLPLTIELE